MSGTGEARVDFGGEERVFRIRLGEIRRIEAKADAGIGEVLRRLSRAVMVLSRLHGVEALSAGLDIKADDVRETLFQGLRGGGMNDAKVSKLLRTEVDDRGVQGILDNVPTALAALWGSQQVPEGDAPGEPAAGANASTPASGQTSEAFSASAPQ